jgi:AcrR family transcriptional regulator
MPQHPRSDRGGAATRTRILEAAERVVRERGLARATTKEIARAAGCSEAALYKHYKDKADLVIAMIMTIVSRPGALCRHLVELPAHAGAQSLEEMLSALAACAIGDYAQAMAMCNAMFAEPDLLEQYRRRLAELGVGPRIPLRELADFLRGEQAAGRVNRNADPDAVSALLLGACFYRAFLDSLLGEGADGVPEFIHTTVSSLLPMLAPAAPSSALPAGQPCATA